ncbi:GNAT family N-acetyltransferase [Actinomadura barringtoniae]|uniref:GNAT family N-acetyltransferase n=1 Tax=Actinomadura barringtoniae TaxID=1427535 RepID=A0A939PHI1_9ACTN|nr:GNAT family N-acetyltransferase [Actinomadura barringtoniae]MBO2452760.1 GNAT family N-acetyltransferase [Actinomadura barringtoniae]
MEIRALTVDDLDAVLDARTRAFGYVPERDRASWLAFARTAVDAGRQLGGFEGDRLVATARVLAFGQWWHGREVSMGGVSGVTVAPEDRGRGAGREIVTAILHLAAERGDVVSALYPATTRIYRSLGWEHAGAQHRITLPAEALRTLSAEPVPVRRVGPDDAEEIVRVLRDVYQGALDHGPVDAGAASWRLKLADERIYCYLAEDGFLSYRWSADGASLDVDRVVAGSERTSRALWAIVGSGSSVVETVSAYVDPYDPVLWSLAERYSDRFQRNQWMLRVVDAPAAFERRGYPAGVSAEVPLHVVDAQLPANSGSWRLVIKDGRGALERAGDDPAAVRMGIQGLSALYAGVRVAALRRSGMISGGDQALLGAAFEAAPFMHDYF